MMECQGMYEECLNSSRIKELEAQNAKLTEELDALRKGIRKARYWNECQALLQENNYG